MTGIGEDITIIFTANATDQNVRAKIVTFETMLLIRFN